MRLALAALAVVVLVCVPVRADDAAKKPADGAAKSAQPAAKKEAKSAAQAEAKPVRLTKPWRDLASLSEDQKRQINQIHRKSVQDVKVIEQRERDEIMALLSDPQKAELKAMEEKAAAERKAKAAEKKPAAKVSQKDAGNQGATTASEEAEGDEDDAAGAN